MSLFVIMAKYNIFTLLWTYNYIHVTIKFPPHKNISTNVRNDEHIKYLYPPGMLGRIFLHASPAIREE